MTIIAITVYAIMIWKLSVMAYKVAYYEQTLKNNRSKFTQDRYEHIEEVMNKWHPF